MGGPVLREKKSDFFSNVIQHIFMNIYFSDIFATLFSLSAEKFTLYTLATGLGKGKTTAMNSWLG